MNFPDNEQIFEKVPTSVTSPMEKMISPTSGTNDKQTKTYPTKIKKYVKYRIFNQLWISGFWFPIPVSGDPGEAALAARLHCALVIWGSRGSGEDDASPLLFSID